jgi:uncharacterized phiE125 gp8 family phage protein
MQPLQKWSVTRPPTAPWTATTPPTAPWTQAFLANHLRVIYGEESSLLHLYVDAAVDYAQEALGMSLGAQEITAVFNDADAGPGTTLRLPRGPVRSITSVTDAAGAPVTGSVLERVACGDRLRLTASVVFPLTVVYEAGFPTEADIPASIRLAVLQHVATLYENRESVSEKGMTPVPHSLEAFYRLKSRNPRVA